MSRTRAITPTELRILLSSLDNPSRLAVMISADTGLRISDICTIQCGNLQRTMKITERKTGKQRKVTFSKKTYDAAVKYASHGKKYLIDCDRSTIYRHIRTIADNYGWKHISMHSIRKYYARRYYAAHGLRATQLELCHDYLSTTLLYLVDDN